jgi:putative DNA methylase
MKKKLIEVALPLEAINDASAREKSIRHGHPSALHLWWARRPLAAARAVIFAQMVDDPSSHPELFATEKAQEIERQRLFRIIENLVQWENTTNEKVLEAAREEIWKSWRSACADNKDDPRVSELFDPNKLPAFHDPFAGGGALPLEAQRLGLEAYASDLNPVAVLIDKATIEIPPKFAGNPPVNPETRKNKQLFNKTWHAAQGLGEDVRHYGEWIRNEAEKRIGHLYPKAEITAEIAKERPDLKPLVGKKLTVIAWIWARTVKSPNPAFARVDVPLASTFILSTKKGREAYVEPVIDGDTYRFTVKVGKPKKPEVAKSGTKLARANFVCLVSGTPIPGDYIKAEGQAGRMSARMMAIVAEGERGREYLPPTQEMERVAGEAHPVWRPPGDVPARLTGGTCVPYGLKEWGDLFTARQLVALTTLSDLAQEVRGRVKQDAVEAGLPDDGKPLADGGVGAVAFADAITLYLAFLVSQVANHSSTGCGWNSANAQMRSVFARQALPMVWDYAESNPFCDSSGSFNNLFDRQVKGFQALGGGAGGKALQADANGQTITANKVVSTDPPYYDNIAYADLSDFFYVWLRRSLKPVFPDLFATLAVPKAEELVAMAYRHGSKEEAEAFFLTGMTHAMHSLAQQAHPAFPVTIYYAFKQSETELTGDTSSTGWETFLDAVIRAGFSTCGTWPMRTEKQGRVVGYETNALASSIVIVCRQRPTNAPSATRRDFVGELKSELPVALTNLQRGNIAPVDLAQAAIGPGMAVYTRYASVLDASGKALSVRDALSLINQTLDEVLAKQEGDFDADTRWALAWFEQFGFAQGEYGVAETLSKAKNTSIAGMVEAAILVSKSGKVRLFRPAELPANWDPARDRRLSAWEIVHQLIRALEVNGESAAAELVAKLGGKAEIARELAYRLYNLCERNKRAQEAFAYNGLVQSWPEIVRLAREGGVPQRKQAGLFEEGEE